MYGGSETGLEITTYYKKSVEAKEGRWNMFSGQLSTTVDIINNFST